ncbi:uncharacterized protein ACRADG_008250 isoform 1-T3 [Cochliomyia hominivorax]
MENLLPKNLQNLCRTCLQELKQRQKYKIQQLNLQIRQWFEDVILGNSLVDDKYPNSLCHSCKNKLNEFLEFHKMCKQSSKTIHQLWETKGKIKVDGLVKNNVEVSELEGNILVYDHSETYKEENKRGASISNAAEKEKVKKGTDNILGNKYSGKNRNMEQKNDTCNDLVEIEEIPLFSESENDTTSKNNNCKNTPSTRETKLCHARVKRKKYSYLFRCDQCKYRGVSQQTLDIHLRTHYGLKPYQCPKCDNAFDKTHILLKHLGETHGDKELIIICEYEECGKQFTSNRNYKNHYRQNHIPPLTSNLKQEKSLLKNSYKHVCEECGKVYTKLQTFKEHQYTHGPKELYPFQCDQCDKAFVKQRTFMEHKLRHAGIKNFECSHCGAKKTTKKELRSHMNSHTRERQYPCPNCHMVFYRSSNRRIHVDVVHQGIRRFACRFCDQTFGKGDNLKNHELLHTGEKPHACTECGKRFVQRVSLRSHMKVHNN